MEGKTKLKAIDVQLRITELENRINYSFKDRHYFEEVFVGEDFYGSQQDVYGPKFRDVATLGDSVLSVAVMDKFIGGRRDYARNLTKYRMDFTNNDYIRKFADKIELKKYIFGNQLKVYAVAGSKSITDAFEALLGAVYLDCKGDVRPVIDILDFMGYFGEKALKGRLVRKQNKNKEICEEDKKSWHEILEMTTNVIDENTYRKEYKPRYWLGWKIAFFDTDVKTDLIVPRGKCNLELVFDQCVIDEMDIYLYEAPYKLKIRGPRVPALKSHDAVWVIRNLRDESIKVMNNDKEIDLYGCEGVIMLILCVKIFKIEVTRLRVRQYTKALIVKQLPDVYEVTMEVNDYTLYL